MNSELIQRFLHGQLLDGRNGKMRRRARQAYNHGAIRRFTAFYVSIIADRASYNRFEELRLQCITTFDMSVREHNRLVTCCIYLYAGYLHYLRTGTTMFTLNQMYDLLYEICGGQCLNFASGRPISDDTEWRMHVRTYLYEFSPSSRQYWSKFNRFVRRRKFPLFMNTTLLECQNGRRWAKGNEGLVRGGIWTFNVSLLSENELREIYPIPAEDEMNELIRNQDTTCLREQRTFNMDREPTKLNVRV